MRLRFIWFIIGFGLPSIQSNDEHGIQENFRDLLDSINENNSKRVDMYRNVLGREATRQKQIFDAVKRDWRSIQERKARERPNFHHGGNVAFKREVQEHDEQIYLFPDIEDGNAINATMDLLRSQRSHQVEIGGLFNVILRRNQAIAVRSDLQSLIGEKIMLAEELITNGTELVEAFMKNGLADADFLREPFRYKASRELIDCWKFIDDFIDDEIEAYGLNAGREVEKMKNYINNAILEVEVYNVHLDKVYNETGIGRDESSFKYSKYGRSYLQPRM